MAEYRQSAHAVFDLKYHMIWCTKYRKKILRGRVAERARDLIRQICAARNTTIIRGAVSPDHIHLLLTAPPALSPANVIDHLKSSFSGPSPVWRRPATSSIIHADLAVS